MADGTTRTDDKQIIAVAAAVAGRTPDGMTIEEAREILRGNGGNKLLDDAINTAARDSQEFFSKSCNYLFKEHPEILKDMLAAAQNGAPALVSFPHIGTLEEALYNYLEPGTEATELEELRRQFVEADYKSLFFTAGLVLILNTLAEILTQGELAGDPAKAAKYLTLLRDVAQSNIKLFELADELQQLEPHIKAELDAAGDVTELIEIYENDIDTRTGTIIPGSRLESLIAAARTAAAIKAQQAGRNQRRQLKADALKGGAIMSFQGENLVSFSARDLWGAFAPGRIAKIGNLPQDEIDDETGEVIKRTLEEGELIPVKAADVSYKAFILLNTILANSVENYRERFFEDGAITFYVKGVIDALDIDPRILEDRVSRTGRKTAGALYLESRFTPLLLLIGMTPEGSRYSVLSYDGYDINTDTMTIRSPYLYQLWRRTQVAFAQRKAAKQERIDAGKKPLKKDLVPLEVNELFKFHALKEDETALEIATYITNKLLEAGKGAHKTEINFKTIIKNCPRLREKLEAIEAAPAQKDGKRINKTARYNSELRKIARAYNIIMDPNKCDATRYYTFDEFTPTKENKKAGRLEFIPPTKSTLKGKITIKWHKNDL